jgi:hypothetical protein
MYSMNYDLRHCKMEEKIIAEVEQK